MQNIFSPIKLAAALGLGLLVTASGASSAEVSHNNKFPTFVRYVYKSTTRGSAGYLELVMRVSPDSANGMVVYLCSANHTAADCGVNVFYTRDQLLTYQAFFQAAIYSRKATPPVIDTGYPCKTAGTYFCPTSFSTLLATD